MSLCCSKDSNVCLAHRVNRVLDISLKLDNDFLESESSKSICRLDHSLFRYNVLFEGSLNTPNRPSGENDGITCLGSYSLYVKPLWCDNIPPKDRNLFLEDENTLKVGAGLLKPEKIFEGVARLSLANDIEFEEQNFIALMNEAREKRAKLEAPAPKIPMEIQDEKALDAIYVCCFGRGLIG
ncbi:hypothetical protein BC332_01711 [Capsicum chinense]|nr:hypothetical protein BC332_01711 [Capsicum chinense]